MLEDILRPSYYMAQWGYPAVVYSINEQGTQDLLCEDIVGETLDPNIAQRLDTKEVANILSKQLVTSILFMAEIQHLCEMQDGPIGAANRTEATKTTKREQVNGVEISNDFMDPLSSCSGRYSVN